MWGATGRFFPPHPLIHISIHAPRVGSDHHAAGLCRCKSISIHAPRVGSDLHSRPEYARGHISIHAPRVGSDGTEYENFTYYFCISIHAPRVGSDFNPEAVAAATQEFQSTLPVWGATAADTANDADLDDFNPRSPCGERRSPGSDGGIKVRFQSTLPVWGATRGRASTVQCGFISIHAPRVGSDQL